MVNKVFLKTQRIYSGVILIPKFGNFFFLIKWILPILNLRLQVIGNMNTDKANSPLNTLMQRRKSQWNKQLKETSTLEHLTY